MSLAARISSAATRKRLLIAAGAAAALGLAGTGVAAAAVTGHSGTSITRAAVVTQDTAAVYTSTAWVNVGSLSIYATAAQFIDVTFTAESACYGGSGWCSIRILVDGVEAEPVVGTDFSFNEAEAANSWESHSVERVRTVTTSATHSVVVQAASVGTGVAHRLDDWTLRALAVAP